MAKSDYPAPKDITLHWRNFIIVMVFIFLVGIIIGLIITPHPDYQKSAAPPPEPRAENNLAWIKQILPDYPGESRQQGVGGEVEVEAQTDSFGRVQSIKLIRSVPALDQMVIEAVRQWVHEPAAIEGTTKGIRFRVIMSFHPEDNHPACRVDYLGPSAGAKKFP
jgi:TonB family protein